MRVMYTWDKKRLRKQQVEHITKNRAKKFRLTLRSEVTENHVYPNEWDGLDGTVWMKRDNHKVIIDKFAR